MTGLVSIIVPNYNHAPYLRERLDSILHQDYSDFEIIILDDCSGDESMTILSEYKNNPHVRSIIRNEHNSGNTFYQWHKGIEMAQGDYVWIAESDDVADKRLISTLVEKMERDSQVTISFCQSQWVDTWGNILHSSVYRQWTHPFIMDGETFAKRYLLGYNFICNASAVVMRRSAALHVSDAYMQYKASGDRQFWIEMALQGKVSYTPEVLNSFRQHNHKVSNDAAQKGQNIMEDYAIYSHFCSQHKLSRWNKIRIHCYHVRAMLSPSVKREYRGKIQQVWKNSWCK